MSDLNQTTDECPRCHGTGLDKSVPPGPCWICQPLTTRKQRQRAEAHTMTVHKQTALPTPEELAICMVDGSAELAGCCVTFCVSSMRSFRSYSRHLRRGVWRISAIVADLERYAMGLLNRYTGSTRIVSSNLIPSASSIA